MLEVPELVVLGGGVDGAAQVERLGRAVAAGRLRTSRILVVDRDARCPAARLTGERPAAPGNGNERALVVLEVSDWSDWLDARLDSLPAGAHLVPYHWAPHLFLTWLERQAAGAGVRTTRAEPLAPRGLPYEATTSGGDRALSYASWPCPPACIEPALCPHTRGPRDWSLAAFLETTGPGERFDDRIVLRCLHLVWGVGTIPVEDVLSARARLLDAAHVRPRTVLVATSSHCHALANAVTVRP